MNRKSLFLGCVFTPLFFLSCSTHYLLTDVKRVRLVVDSTYDTSLDSQTVLFMMPYKHIVDSMMGPVLCRTAYDMRSYRPESPLSNLLADILLWAGRDYKEKPDFAIYNMGGIRSELPQGDISYGDVLNIAPFENKICFLTLSGIQVLELFNQIASTGGEGVSHGVELVITKSGKLISAHLNGKNIIPTSSYRISTIDYLAQGNDKMLAFKNGTNLHSSSSKENDTRFIIMNYFKQMNTDGVVVDSKIEGRIKIQ